ncbi:electron transport complex subunit RsxG [Exilibacterium tricleocarpae]|uniref:Ion-translocating oxidoreductase complex subunit G n=1 Tax=Exilibacterium tricleocarpae TaxID=2591008 RepID=A0A545U5Q3_9GAMM|nr:electron transport complex subunit RsxG [Exilibacterium tricleocarpae]TQV84733.1 electron transport complex subunit RsxG [Exilibacterium tricleocarpae]
MLGTSIGSNSLILGVFALATAALLSGTYQGTRDRIASEERKAAQKALLEIVPSSRHNNDLLMDTLAVPKVHWELLGLKNGGDINIARDGDQPIAVIIPAVAPDGYSGAIKLIAGVNRDGTLAGVRVLAHTETPGLGDKVDLKKSDWILGFNGTSLQSPMPDQWQVKKDGGDFDQFTGATITPRAVVKQVRKVLEFYQLNQTLLFEAEPAPQSEEPVNE